MDSKLQRYTLHENATLQQALTAFASPVATGARRRTCLSIVSAEGTLLRGLVSERDVVRAVLDGMHGDALVTAFMVPAERLSVLTAETFLETDPLTLSCIMARSGFKHLPIVASTTMPRIVGVLDSIAVAEQLSSATRAAGALVVSMTGSTKHVLVVQEGDSVATAAQRMLETRTTAAVVRRTGETHARAFGGLVTLADILRKVPDAAAWGVTLVRAIYTPKAVCATVNMRTLKGASD